MKMKVLYSLSLGVLFSLSSCCTLFTSSRQTITFSGNEGARIYDNGVKIATLDENGEATARVRKKLSSKSLVVKKEGYRTAPLRLEPTINPVAFVNLLNVPCWAIDLLTQKACKWDNTFVEFELDKK